MSTEKTPIPIVEPFSIPLEQVHIKRSRILNYPNLALNAIVLLLLFLDLYKYSSLLHHPAPYIKVMEPLTKLRIGTFNIRYDPQFTHPLRRPSTSGERFRTPERDEDGWGEKRWKDRRIPLVNTVDWEALDIVGFQEVLNAQLEDLRGLLGEGWKGVGVGRDDGKKAGEAVPIFYRKDRFALLSTEFFWLSKTPNRPGSKDWDAGQTRMVTMLHLKPMSSNTYPRDSHISKSDSRSGGDDFYVLNTHWDDRGEESRFRAGELLIDRLNTRKEELKGKLVILLGDLNSPAEERGYRVLTGQRYVPQPLHDERDDKIRFLDTKEELRIRKVGSVTGKSRSLGRYGETHTFTGFSSDDEKTIIDFILFFDNEVVPTTNSLSASSSEKELNGLKGWSVSKYGVVPNRFEDGVRMSDHRLVVAEFTRED